jgi:8-oxo-dGTP diphosphatase
MKSIDVVAAIIIKDDKILCVQRGHHKREYIAFKYEFPGGKVEENETNEAALKREIKEELNVGIEIKKEFLTVNHKYPDFMLIMHSYLCSWDNSQIELSEHVDFKWLEKSELSSLDWAAADIPIVEGLQNALL